MRLHERGGCERLRGWGECLGGVDLWIEHDLGVDFEVGKHRPRQRKQTGRRTKREGERDKRGERQNDRSNGQTSPLGATTRWGQTWIRSPEQVLSVT